MRPPPEDTERLVEQWQVVHTVDQQAAQRVVEVRAPPHVDMHERRRHVARPACLHVEAEPMQQPAKVQQVLQQEGVGHSGCAAL